MGYNYIFMLPDDKGYHTLSDITNFVPEIKWAPHCTLPHVKMLPPPKSYLAPGSLIVNRRNYLYRVLHTEKEHVQNAVLLNKQIVYNDEDSVRIVNLVRRLDKLREITSEVKHKKWSLTYNKKTRKLYYTYYKRVTVGKVKRSIRQLKSFSVNPHFIITAAAAINDDVLQYFVEIIEKEVRKIVPDIETNKFKHHDNSPNYAYYLYQLMMQVKADRVLTFINDDFIKSMSFLFSMKGQSNVAHPLNFLIANDMNNLTKKDINKFNRKYLYKLFPELQKRGSHKTVYRHVLGSYYSSLFYKLLINGFNNCAQHIANAQSYGKNKVDKSTLHFINHVLDDKYHLTNNMKRRILNEVSYGQISAAMSFAANGNDSELKIANDYTRLIRSLVEKDGAGDEHGRSIQYLTFRDTIHMSEEFGVRVRINRFNDYQEVLNLHATLVTYQNRDNTNLLDYGDVQFLPINTPNCMYDGYQMVQMRTGEDLVNEGRAMSHCVGSRMYIDSCIHGRSLIFSLRKGTESVVTVEIDGSSNRFQIKQMYMAHDHKVTDELSLLIDKWQEDMVKIHSRDTSTYLERVKLTKIIDSYHTMCEFKSNEFIDGELPTVEELQEKLDKYMAEEGHDTNVSIEDTNLYDDVDVNFVYSTGFEIASQLSW
jgi:hypothetical protein